MEGADGGYVGSGVRIGRGLSSLCGCLWLWSSVGVLTAMVGLWLPYLP
jgi:hypothetical protein